MVGIPPTSKAQQSWILWDGQFGDGLVALWIHFWHLLATQVGITWGVYSKGDG